MKRYYNNTKSNVPHPTPAPSKKEKGHKYAKVSFHKIVANLLYCHILKLYISAVVLNRIGSMLAPILV
jgi:hypothetical protein